MLPITSDVLLAKLVANKESRLNGFKEVMPWFRKDEQLGEPRKLDFKSNVCFETSSAIPNFCGNHFANLKVVSKRTLK